MVHLAVIVSHVSFRVHFQIYSNEQKTPLVHTNVDVNGHERLFNNTLRHKCKEMNIAFVAVLYFKVTVESSTMSITDTVK